jgi:putative ABC transport system permease protein
MATEPSLLGLAASGILVAVAVGLSLRRRLGLSRSMVWAAARALVQLLAIGVALQLVIDPDRPIAYSWAWVAVMVLFAGWTSQRRAPEVPGGFSLSVIAYSTSAVVSLGVLFGFSIFPVEGRTVVPLAGMVVGNSLASTVLVGRRIVAELSDKRDEVEARLALGMTSGDAAQPFLRTAVRTALIPQIETTKAVGIVFLPGAMVGLILGGAEPLAAVKVQLAVMYLILGSVATTTSVVAVGLSRRLFTPDHRLVRLDGPDSAPTG